MPFWLSILSVRLLHRFSIMTLLKHDMVITDAAGIWHMRGSVALLENCGEVESNDIEKEKCLLFSHWLMFIIT